MIRLLRYTIVSGLLLLGIGLSVSAWILLTSRGTAFFWSILNPQIPELRVEGVQGSFWHGIEIARLNYRDESLAIEIAPLRVRVDFPAIFARKAIVERIELGEVRLQTSETASSEEGPEESGGWTGIPFLHEIALKRLAIHSLVDQNNTWSARAIETSARLSYGNESQAWSLEGSFAGGFQFEKIDGHIQLKLEGPLDQLKVELSEKSTLGDLEITSRIADLPTQARFQLHAELKNLAPEVLLAKDIGDYDAVLAASGSLENCKGKLTITQSRASPMQPLDFLQAAFALEGEQLHIPELAATSKNQQILHGALTVPFSDWMKSQANFEIQGLNLAGFDSELPATDLEGNIALRPDSGNAEIELRIVDNQLGDLAASIDLNPEQARLKKLKLDSGSGWAEISGRLEFSGHQNYAISAKAHEFNPGVWVEDLPGNLGFAMKAQGSLQALSTDARLEFEPGSWLKSTPMSGALKFSLSEQGVARGAGGIRWGNSQIMLENLDRQLDIHFTAIDPGLVLDDSGADLSGTARLRFKSDSIDIDLDARSPKLHYQEYSGKELALNLHGNSSKPEKLAFELQLGQMNLPAEQGRVENLELTGSLAQHRFEAQYQLGANQAQIKITGAFKAPEYRGKLEDFRIQSKDQGRFGLASPAPFAASPKAFRLGPLLLHALESENAQERMEMEISLDLEKYRFTSRGRFHEIDLKRLAFLNSGPVSNGALNADWELGYDSTSEPLSGSLSAAIGALKIALDDKSEPFVLESSSLSLTGQGTNINLDLSVKQNRANRLQSQIRASRIPGFQEILEQDSAWKMIELVGQVALELEDLTVLSQIAPKIPTRSGQIQGHIDIGGKLNNPELLGAVTLQDFGFRVPEYGINAEIPLAQVEFDRQRLRLNRLDLRTPDSAGSASATGDFALNPSERGNFRVNFKGSSLQLVNQSTLKFEVSPDLTISGTANQLNIEGILRIDKGYFAEIAESGGVSLSSDVVVAENAKAIENPPSASLGQGIHLEIDIEIPDSFVVKAAGANLLLGGKLEVTQAKAGIPLADGELYVADNPFSKNTFTVYGQVLNIEKGSLLFAQSPVNDPGLNILAVRKVTAGKVGVLVSGTASAPEVNLQSDQTMSDSEILSWLLTGHSPTEAGKGFQAMLLAAGSELSGSGPSVLERTRNFVGLDELSLDAKEDSAAGFLNLGKRLGDNLYLNYQQGILEQGYKIKATYKLTPAWSVIAESAQQSNAVEIEWSKRFKGLTDLFRNICC